MSYKLEELNQLMEALRAKGLRVELMYDGEHGEQYLDVFYGNVKIGQFEFGNVTWELVCYSQEGEDLSKKFKLLDLVDEYWQWFKPEVNSNNVV